MSGRFEVLLQLHRCLILHLIARLRVSALKMPAGRKGKAKPPAAVPPLDVEEEFSCGEEADSPNTGCSEPLRGKKRRYGATDEPEPAFGGEMQSLLNSFGADISKSLASKRKRLEGFTQASLKTSNKKVEEVWRTQHEERQRLGDEYKKQVEGVLCQWETDVEKSKESEEKMQTLLKQQQKLFQQQRIVQAQRLKTIKQLHEQYMKGMDELDRCHHEQQSSMQGELKKEMALLQKKILMETQHQEISNVKRSLQSMLSQV